MFRVLEHGFCVLDDEEFGGEGEHPKAVQAGASAAANCDRPRTVLNVQHLSVLDLLDPTEINRRATLQPPSEDDFENVVVVVATTQARVMNQSVKDVLKFKKGFLRKLRPEVEGERQHWERFVVITAGSDGMSMYPRLLQGSTILIDRHYNSLKPYRKDELNMYGVKKGGACTVK